MPNRLATVIAAHACSNWNRAAEFLIWNPSASSELRKYSPTTAPIMARTVATLSAENRYGSAFGNRTRPKIVTSEAAYERISSIDDGRTDVSPLVVLTITGKNTRIAAMAIFEVFSSGPNHWLVIGANAMIGTALAAMANGISARPSRRKRAITTAVRTPSRLPATQPPNASEKV